MSKKARLKKFEDADSIFILGNGPSIKKVLQEKSNLLRSKPLICVNHFGETEAYSELKPSIYVLNAAEMWRDDVDEFHYKKGEKLFQSIAENTQWEIDLFIPFEAKKWPRWQLAFKKNEKIKVNYFNNCPVEGYKTFTNFWFKRDRGMPRPHNVLIPSLMIGIAQKPKNLYVLGADHSWMSELWVTDQNEVLLTQKHFYDEGKATAKGMDNAGRGTRKLHEILIKWYHAFKGYFVIQNYAESNGCRIINLTEGSFIDAFERGNIDSIEE